jgi:hypothetical protein
MQGRLPQNNGKKASKRVKQEKKPQKKCKSI